MLPKNKLSSYFLYAIGEILLIAVGIFMALQLQNWNERKKTQAATLTAIKSIKKEILTNQESINEVYDYHVMVKDTINKMVMPKTEEEATNSLSFWRGLRVFRLQGAAFQTAIQTGSSSEMDLSLLESLNSLYTSQESYNDFSKTAVQGLYANDFTELKNFKKIATFLNMTMVDLYYMENELKESFEGCIQKIDSIYPY